MATTKLADLAVGVNAFVIGCPNDTIKIMLRHAAQQFARDTRIWKKRLGSAAIMAGSAELGIEVAVPSADYPLPDGSRIVAIERLYFNLEERRPQALRRPGVGRIYEYDLDEEVLSIHPQVITQDGRLTVEASLEPTDTATSVPATLARWNSALRDYALFLLRGIPDEKWTSPRGAQSALKAYQVKVAGATVRAAKQGTSAPIRVRHHPFA